MPKPYATLELPSKEAADAVREALNHVHREIFDSATTGTGKHLDDALRQLRIGAVARR